MSRHGPLRVCSRVRATIPRCQLDALHRASRFVKSKSDSEALLRLQRRLEEKTAVMVMMEPGEPIATVEA
jgi:hypothetical protein